MPRMKAIAAAVQILQREGVRHAFGVPGAAINPFYAALRERYFTREPDNSWRVKDEIRNREQFGRLNLYDEARVSLLGQLDRGSRVEDAIKRIAATMACHAAVKANYPLTPEKMLHILEELRRTAYSTICPHGRPVMLRLTKREIEKNFERI